MKLMTKELEERFKENPLYSQESKGFDATVVVKYFNPFSSGTWLITEGERQLMEIGFYLVTAYIPIGKNSYSIL